MSRFTGPRVKVMRALGCELPGLSRKSLPADASRPGQHGRRPQRLSDFANKLREKQKIRFNYGLRESQLRKLMTEAKHAKDPTATSCWNWWSGAWTTRCSAPASPPPCPPRGS